MKAPSISNILDITVSFSWLLWMSTTESFTLMLVPMAELAIQDFFATLDYMRDWRKNPWASMKPYLGQEDMTLYHTVWLAMMLLG